MSAPKLTKPQYFLLVELSDRDQRVMSYYAPANKLVEIGLASKRQEAFGSCTISITEAGRQALAAI